MAGSDYTNIPFKTWLKEYAPAGLNFPKAFVAHYAEVPNKDFLEMYHALHAGRTAEKLLNQTTDVYAYTFQFAYEVIEQELRTRRPHDSPCDCNWCTHDWF